jgi:hypothetical protein
MSRIFAYAVLVASLFAALTAATAGAARIGHDHLTSDPYADQWCGIVGTSVDYVVANYTLDGPRTSLNVRTIFTATASGKSMEIKQTGLRLESAPVDNGNGTYSIFFTSAGQSPAFRLPTGAVIIDTGFVESVATFDSATGDFISFDIVKQAGPRPLACNAIVAALS